MDGTRTPTLNARASWRQICSVYQPWYGVQRNKLNRQSEGLKRESFEFLLDGTVRVGVSKVELLSHLFEKPSIYFRV